MKIKWKEKVQDTVDSISLLSDYYISRKDIHTENTPFFLSWYTGQELTYRFLLETILTLKMSQVKVMKCGHR